MGNIVLLDDLTINKIAAGEVIERPSSVVKEMVENSIDAGAKNITVEIKNGGISLIRITDDGCGISEDDMEIAFERHATSKIRSADDLSTVKSMGFRGEALASIAAIAKVEMISKKDFERSGHKIIVEGGKILNFTEAARNVGTTITVENLFYNTPVRYKFLKKDYTEAGYIEDAVTKIALVNKDIAIKLISNGKTIIQTNGNGDINTVIYSIYGKDVASEMIEVSYDYEGIKVEGVIGKPVISRGNRSNQIFFVNGRTVKDKSLTAAVDQAYKGIVTVGRYAFVVLNVIMDSQKVDVNVHPAKLEVRFEDENQVFKAVYHTIKANLTDLIQGDVKDTRKEIDNQVSISNFNDINSQENIEKKEEIEEKVEEPINKEKSSNQNTGTIDRTDFEARWNALKQEKQERQEKEKKGGIAGLFKKFIKEQDETDEELNNNSLAEIYNKRQNLSKNNNQENFESDTNLKNVVEKEEVKENIEDITLNVNQDKVSEEIIKNEESNLINKEENKTEENKIDNVEYDDKILENLKNEFFNSKNINNTISNDSSFNIVNKDEVNKEVTLGDTIISSTTREINVTDVNTLIKEATQKMNTLKEENLSDDLRNEVVNDKTLRIDNDNDEKNVELTPKNEINSDFNKIAEKLIEDKLVSDNTQSINTQAVRDAIKDEVIEEKVESTQNNPEFNQMYKKTFGVDSYVVRKEKEKEEQEKNKYNVTNEFNYIPTSENMSVFEDEEEQVKIPYKFVGIAFNNYLVIEIKDELYIIDKVVASEKIMFEKLKETYYDSETQSEQLLMPDILKVNKKELDIANENTNMFLKAGFEFEEFGDNTLKLSAVPSICEQLNTKLLFKEILSELDKVAVTAIEEKENKFIAIIASKVVAENISNFEEKDIPELLDQLMCLNNPFSSINNKPVAIKMTRADLEKKFSRR